MTDPRQELEEYLDNWYALLPKGNAEMFASLYTTDARLLLSGMAAVSGDGKIGAFLASISGYVDVVSCKHKVTEVEFLATDIAVISGSSWVDSKPKGGGEIIHDAQRFLMVMKRDAALGRWLCQFDMSQNAPSVS